MLLDIQGSRQYFTNPVAKNRLSKDFYELLNYAVKFDSGNVVKIHCNNGDECEELIRRIRHNFVEFEFEIEDEKTVWVIPPRAQRRYQVQWQHRDSKGRFTKAVQHPLAQAEEAAVQPA